MEGTIDGPCQDPGAVSCRAAMSALFAQHREKVRRYLTGRVRDTHAAEDLTQETLIRALRYAEQLRGSDHAAGWLIRIAWGVSLDYFRLRARRRVELCADGVMEPDCLVHESAVPELAEERVAGRMLRSRLLVALARIGKRDRVLMVGHYFVGLSCGELAARSGLTRDNVKMRLFRARRTMREQAIGWPEAAAA